MSIEQLRMDVLRLAVQTYAGSINADDVLEISEKFMNFVETGNKPVSENLKNLVNFGTTHDVGTFEEFLCSGIRLPDATLGSRAINIHPYHRAIINALDGHISVIGLWARGMGSTTMCALYGLWWSLKHPNSKVAIIDTHIGAEMSVLSLIRTINKISNRSDFLDQDENRKDIIRVSNGSEIFAVGKRGARDADLVILPSAGFIPYSRTDEIRSSLEHVRMSGGKILMMSALPKEKKGFFYDAIKGYPDNYYAMVTANGLSNPEWNSDWHRTNKNQMGENAYRLEILNEWVATD